MREGIDRDSYSGVLVNTPDATSKQGNSRQCNGDSSSMQTGWSVFYRELHRWILSRTANSVEGQLHHERA